MAGEILGPDCSHFQPSPQWDTVGGDARFRFAILKATEGEDYPFADYYLENAPRVRRAGLILGAYHFLIIREDGAAQARYFLEVAPRADMYAVDVEGSLGNDEFGAAAIVACVKEFSTEFKRLRPDKPLALYGRTLMRDKGIQDRMGCDYLWAPRYNGSTLNRANLGPCTDYGWADDAIRFWQFTNGKDGPEPHSVPGIGNCDVSVFFGTMEQLRRLAGGAPPPGGRGPRAPAATSPARWAEEDWRALLDRLPPTHPDDKRVRQYLLGQLDRRVGRPVPDDPGARRNGWLHEDDLIAVRRTVKRDGGGPG